MSQDEVDDDYEFDDGPVADDYANLGHEEAAGFQLQIITTRVLCGGACWREAAVALGLVTRMMRYLKDPMFLYSTVG